MMIPNGAGGFNYVPDSGGKREEPKCPHCHKELKGWSGPSTDSLKDCLIVISIIMLIIVQFSGAIIGSVGNTFGCDRFGDKRYHYIVPALTVGCVATRWLSNKKHIYSDEYRY